MQVHAHPDDEASKGACTTAKYRKLGVRTVLVCATGGEAGDILNAAMDTPEVRADLHAIRMEELRRATEIIGYDETIMLGYRDSGMPDSPSNVHPGCFAQADLHEATGRLVEAIRRTKPQVIVTYSDDQSGYPHPDHLRVHDISVAAFDASADASRYPDSGDPWQPLKLYYMTWSKARMLATHAKFQELGLESPFSEEWLARPGADERITARIDVDGFMDVRRDALLAHATQVDPSSKFWFGLPPEVARTVHPFEEFILARTLVETPDFEDDLFSGIV